MDIAIDLGSSRTAIYLETRGKVLDSTSVVACDSTEERVLAVGDEAYNMIGKTPAGITAEYPIEGGVITNSRLAERMVSAMLRQAADFRVSLPRVVASVPCGLTEVEKRAVINTVSVAGARKVFLLESPKAAAIGCGVDITAPKGTMAAVIGAGTADIGVISLGGLTVSRSTRRAGRAMDSAIVDYVRDKYRLMIGENMAERCKKEIGCVKPFEEERVFRVKGRDTVSGLPSYADIGSGEISTAIIPVAMGIVSEIKSALENTPPELVGDISTEGILLTGGLAALSGLGKLVSEQTGLRVKVHKFAADCVIMGCGKALRMIPEAERGESTSPLVVI